MRESFIFHFEYIEDIPEELQPEYVMYVINYARYGEEPTFDDWRDQRMWNRTKARMDEEASRYNRKCANLRKGKQTETEIQEEVELEAENKEEPKPTKKRFEKPTPEEVQEYCDERQNGISGEQFCSYYESKGWRIGSSQMKDWKAAVRTWELRRKTDPPKQSKAMPEDRQML